MKNSSFIAALSSAVYFLTFNAVAVPLNTSVNSNLVSGTWLSSGSSLSGLFNIHHLGNIDANYGAANFTFYADFDGYNAPSVTNGNWVYVGEDCGVFFCDDLWERKVTRHYTDDKETATVSILGSQMDTVTSGVSYHDNIYSHVTGYIHHWDWEGSVDEWDDHGRDKVYDEHTHYEGNFYSSLILDPASLLYLETTEALPFTITSDFGDFMYVSAVLNLTYRRVDMPEPSTLFLAFFGLIGVLIKKIREERMGEVSFATSTVKITLLPAQSPPIANADTLGHAHPRSNYTVYHHVDGNTLV